MAWSRNTEELGREEMLLSLLQILQPVVQDLLSGYCPVSFLPSIPNLSMHRPNNSKIK